MDFAAVKLRKTTTREASAVPGPVICGDDADYGRLMDETRLEAYFEALGDVTFATSFLPITQADLILAHERKEWREIPSLVALAEQIDAERTRRGWELVFVRLSSRSPKDAALAGTRFKELLRHHYRKVVHDEGHSRQNEKLLALYAASTEVMGCRNGAECLDLLAASERIQDDLRSMTDLQLCVRQFVAFSPEFEVRGFVWDGSFTALTQYNHLVCSKKAIAARQKTLDACQSCFDEKISKRITNLTRFSIDFVVIGDHAYVVEINPLAEFTGMGLFDWQSPADREVITGKSPFEFRIAESIPEIVELAPEFERMLESFDWE